MRGPTVLSAVLCLLVLSAPSSYATDNTDENGDPCFNTVNGVRTSATDVDGIIVIGCNNVINNNTLPTDTSATVHVEGSNNVLTGNVQHNQNGDGYDMAVYGDGNTVKNNEADDYMSIGAPWCRACRAPLRPLRGPERE